MSALLRALFALAPFALLSLWTPLSYGHGAANDYESDVEAMYVAYYGRPGDPGGVAFWAEQLEQSAGDFSAIIDSFGNSDEYNQRFSGLSDEALVDNIYQQLFGRGADADGLDFYLGKLQSGELTLASIALDITNGVQNLDALIVANKLTVAHAFTEHVQDNDASYGADEIDAARALLDGVDETEASIAAAVAQLATLFDLPGSADCTAFEGSFDRIQSIIFAGYGCTNSACHGSATPTGELDLRPEMAYQSLFRVNASANLAEDMQLVYPGEQALSFLYQKLEAGTNGTALPSGGGTPMPVGAAPISADHLEAMRLWIRGGAPEFSDVDNVASLLGCSVGTVPNANKIPAPDAPAVGEGVQFVSGPWTVVANSEKEVCFATYYDLAQAPEYLPEWAKVACEGSVYADYDGECFAHNVSTLTQDPQSHHSIITTYVGSTSPLDPAWGEWQCLNGPHAGTSCDPTKIGVPVEHGGADCGGRLTVCGTEARRSIACTGMGAPDQRQRRVGMGGAQSPVSRNNLADGVYSVLPARGVIIWNSHAFNLSPEDTTVDQYNSFMFAAEEQRVYRNREIFDAKDIFIAQVPPYEERTYCSTYLLPRGARLTKLSSHAHKRGVLWQTWLPPQDPNCQVTSKCQPNATPPDYVSRIYNDPLYLEYDPPLEYDSAELSERTIKFCLTYDNGMNFPDLLKRSSTSVGTTCPNAAYCVGGATPGLACGSDDSACGDGGVCDACVVSGGFTTEDEMFILLGGYYVVPVQ
ncbi:MAG: DUF4214 domain-containing protein [Gammaproteobacteria bacterium]|nr:DUF4214 domain-containing protein [Gammaproteobacteria bacterium]